MIQSRDTVAIGKMTFGQFADLITSLSKRLQKRIIQLAVGIGFLLTRVKKLGWALTGEFVAGLSQIAILFHAQILSLLDDLLNISKYDLHDFIVMFKNDATLRFFDVILGL